MAPKRLLKGRQWCHILRKYVAVTLILKKVIIMRSSTCAHFLHCEYFQHYFKTSWRGAIASQLASLCLFGVSINWHFICQSTTSPVPVNFHQEWTRIITAANIEKFIQWKFVKSLFKVNTQCGCKMNKYYNRFGEIIEKVFKLLC